MVEMSEEPSGPVLSVGADNDMVGLPPHQRMETTVVVEGFSFAPDADLEMTGSIAGSVHTDSTGFFLLQQTVVPALPCNGGVDVTVAGVSAGSLVRCLDIPLPDGPAHATG
jgi:hypothetical protein